MWYSACLRYDDTHAPIIIDKWGDGFLQVDLTLIFLHLVESILPFTYNYYFCLLGDGMFVMEATGKNLLWVDDHCNSTCNDAIRKDVHYTNDQWPTRVSVKLWKVLWDQSRQTLDERKILNYRTFDWNIGTLSRVLWAFYHPLIPRVRTDTHVPRRGWGRVIEDTTYSFWFIN